MSPFSPWRIGRLLPNAFSSAARRLLRTPLFAAAVVASLSVGVALNGAMFAVLDRLFLRPIPGIGQAAELREAQRVDSGQGQPRSQRFTWPEYKALARSAVGLHFVAAFDDASALVASGTGYSQERVTLVTPRFFAVLRVALMQGQGFSVSDDDLTPVREVVLSAAAATRTFGRAESALGHDIDVGGKFYRVVGVAAREFAGLTVDEPFAWIPLGCATDFGYNRDRIASTELDWIRIVARFPGGSTSRAEMEAGRVLQDASSRDVGAGARAGISWEPIFIGYGSRATTRLALLCLSILAVIALVIAASNVASLTAEREEARKRMMATRLALGATLGDLCALVLAEVVLLGAVAAGVSVAVMRLFERWLVATRVGVVLHAVSLDSIALVVLLSVGVLSAINIVVLLRTHRGAPSDNLREGATSRRSAALGMRRLMLGSHLLLATMLSSIALTADIRLHRIRTLDLGYDPENIVVVRCRGDFGQQLVNACGAMAARLRAVPNVEGVAMAALPPFEGRMFNDVITRYSGNQAQSVYLDEVDSAYFRTLGLPIRAGRGFGAADRYDSEIVAIVNQTMARRFWPGRNPVGECLGPDKEHCTVTVIGVTDDSRYLSPNERPMPFYYMPAAQTPIGEPGYLLLRLDGKTSNANTLQVLRHLLRDTTIAPRFYDPAWDVHPISARLEILLMPWRVAAILFSTLAAVALVLSMLGVFALISATLRTRRQEIAIRIALGAEHHDIWKLVGRVVGALALATIFAGAVVTVAAAYVVADRVPDLMTIVESARLGAAAAVACASLSVTLSVWWPMTRVLSSEPAEVLKAA